MSLSTGISPPLESVVPSYGDLPMTATNARSLSELPGVGQSSPRSKKCFPESVRRLLHAHKNGAGPALLRPQLTSPFPQSQPRGCEDNLLTPSGKRGRRAKTASGCRHRLWGTYVVARGRRCFLGHVTFTLQPMGTASDHVNTGFRDSSPYHGGYPDGGSA